MKFKSDAQRKAVMAAMTKTITGPTAQRTRTITVYKQTLKNKIILKILQSRQNSEKARLKKELQKQGISDAGYKATMGWREIPNEIISEGKTIKDKAKLQVLIQSLQDRSKKLNQISLQWKKGSAKEKYWSYE